MMPCQIWILNGPKYLLPNRAASWSWSGGAVMATKELTLTSRTKCYVSRDEYAAPAAGMPHVHAKSKAAPPTRQVLRLLGDGRRVCVKLRKTTAGPLCAAWHQHAHLRDRTRPFLPCALAPRGAIVMECESISQ